MSNRFRLLRRRHLAQTHSYGVWTSSITVITGKLMRPGKGFGRLRIKTEPVTNFGKKCFSRRPLMSAAVRRFFAVSHCKYVSAATRTVGGWQHYHVPIVT